MFTFYGVTLLAVPSPSPDVTPIIVPVITAVPNITGKTSSVGLVSKNAPPAMQHPSLDSNTSSSSSSSSSLIGCSFSSPSAPKKYPLGIKNRKELDSALDEHYEIWVTQPLGILDGKTPEEAKNTKQGREQLAIVLNELESLYEQAKKRGEPYYDINKLRRQLDMV